MRKSNSAEWNFSDFSFQPFEHMILNSKILCIGLRGNFVLKTLSGRFVILTALVVIIGEVLILIPLASQFRLTYLNARLERAQIASLALLANDMPSSEIQDELLLNAEVYNVVLRRDQTRNLILSSPVPQMISQTYDLRNLRPWEGLGDGLRLLFSPQEAVIRVIGAPVQQAGLEIEITLSTRPMYEALWSYMAITAFNLTLIALGLAAVLTLFAQILVIFPIKRLMNAMQKVAAAPERQQKAIVPRSSVSEVKDAEAALAAMQSAVSDALFQKERLASLGLSLAKVSHDLRNILTTTQIFTELLEHSDDPKVNKLVPKMEASVARAITLCETTLAYGRPDSLQVNLKPTALQGFLQDVMDAEAVLAPPEITFHIECEAKFSAKIDPDHMYRALTNVLRNARLAMQEHGKAGKITIKATQSDQQTTLVIEDEGPGIPANLRERIFDPFHSGNKRQGTGLGLAIARELIEAQNGQIKLLHTSSNGTGFTISLPRPNDCPD